MVMAAPAGAPILTPSASGPYTSCLVIRNYPYGAGMLSVPYFQTEVMRGIR